MMSLFRFKKKTKNATQQTTASGGSSNPTPPPELAPNSPISRGNPLVGETKFVDDHRLAQSVGTGFVEGLDAQVDDDETAGLGHSSFEMDREEMAKQVQEISGMIEDVRMALGNLTVMVENKFKEGTLNVSDIEVLKEEVLGILNEVNGSIKIVEG